MTVVSLGDMTFESIECVCLYYVYYLPPDESELPKYEDLDAMETQNTIVKMIKDEETEGLYRGPNDYRQFRFNTILIYSKDGLLVSYGYNEYILNLATIRNMNVRIYITKLEAELAQIEISYDQYQEHSLRYNFKEGELEKLEGHQDLFLDVYTAKSTVNRLNEKVAYNERSKIREEKSDSRYDILLEGNILTSSDTDVHHKFPELYWNIEELMYNAFEVTHTDEEWEDLLTFQAGVTFSRNGIQLFYWERITWDETDYLVISLWGSGAYKRVKVYLIPYSTRLDDFLTNEEPYQTKIFDYFDNLVIFGKSSIQGIEAKEDISDSFDYRTYKSDFSDKTQVEIVYIKAQVGVTENGSTQTLDFLVSGSAEGSIVPNDLFDLTSSYYKWTDDSLNEYFLHGDSTQIYDGYDPRINSQNTNYSEAREIVSRMKTAIKTEMNRVFNDKIRYTEGNVSSWLKICEGGILYQIGSGKIFELIPLKPVNDVKSLWYKYEEGDHVQFSNMSYLLLREGKYYINLGYEDLLLDVEGILKYSRGTLIRLTKNDAREV